MKFTVRGVQSLKPRAERYEVWEDNGKGFGLRVSPSGRKSWIFLYRYNGKPRRMTFGTFPHTSLATAHEKHAQARKLLEEKIDPGDHLQEEKRVDRSAITVAGLVDFYIDEYAKKQKKSWKEDERMLTKDIVPRWGKRKAKNISRRDVSELVDEIAARGSPISARRTYATLRKMYRFGIRKHILHDTPCAEIELPGQERKRDRVLSYTEIRRLWSHLDDAQISPATAMGLKLGLLTAQRIGEVGEAEWSEFDLDASWWTIPASKTKNAVIHDVPLSPQSAQVLAELRKLAGNSPYLFSSPSCTESMTVRAFNRAIQRNLDTWEIKQFTARDLRRTAASHMTGMGVPRLIVKKILNYVDGDVTAIYDRYAFQKERREALEAWGNKLDATIHGVTDSVVSPRRRSTAFLCMPN